MGQVAGNNANTGVNDDKDNKEQRQRWEEDFDNKPCLGESSMALKQLVVGEAGNKPQAWHLDIVFNLILNGVDYNTLHISNILVYQMILFICYPP